MRGHHYNQIGDGAWHQEATKEQYYRNTEREIYPHVPKEDLGGTMCTQSVLMEVFTPTI